MYHPEFPRQPPIPCRLPRERHTLSSVDEAQLHLDIAAAIDLAIEKGVAPAALGATLVRLLAAARHWQAETEVDDPMGIYQVLVRLPDETLSRLHNSFLTEPHSVGTVRGAA